MAPIGSNQHINHTMATTLSRNYSETSTAITNGWIRQPNGRGTWDILQACVVTVILCSWSSLCLNIHRGKGRHSLWRNKLRWMVFTVFWPEVTASSAFEQWESACQSVQDFSKAGYTEWTMRHAFLADMGGFLLHSPDFPPFPVDGQQLLYLVQKNYVAYPHHVTAEYIWDKNKADGFTRAITLVQITWFSLNCIGRSAQHLSISALELLTISFIYCTLFSFFFWLQKPVDVHTPIDLHSKKSIAEILIEAGNAAKSPYKLTPLDFLVPSPSRTNFVATWWWGVELCFGGIFFEINESSRPVTTFANSRCHPPKGYNHLTFFSRLIFSLGYFSLHFAGWNLTLPTPIEQKLWRAGIGWFAAEYSLYLVIFAFISGFSHWIARNYYYTDANTFVEVFDLFPRWFKLVCLVPVYGSYGVIRLYIVVEGFISLRSLPAEVYSSVDWSRYIPHF